SERAFLEQRVLARSLNRLVFAIGKADLLEPDELRQAIAYAEAHLSRIVAEPQVYPISAKTGEGVATLSAHLERLLHEDRARYLLDHAIVDGLRTTVFVRQSLGLRARALELALDELEAKVARVREQLDVSAQMLRTHAERIRTECEAIKAVA